MSNNGTERAQKIFEDLEEELKNVSDEVYLTVMEELSEMAANAYNAKVDEM